jgi:hypothetical protein
LILGIATATSELYDVKKTVENLNRTISQMKREDSSNSIRFRSLCNDRENKIKELVELVNRISKLSREIKSLSELLTYFGKYLPQLEKVLER